MGNIRLSIPRSLVRWARTLPGNLATIRPYAWVEWDWWYWALGLSFAFDADPGDKHYWLHFTSARIRWEFIFLRGEIGLKDTG